MKTLGWGKRKVKFPIASFTRDRPGTNGGMPMVRELFAGHAVEMFWPGTGPIVDSERQALKEFYRVYNVLTPSLVGTTRSITSEAPEVR